jgi:hypothetical protein
VKSHNKIHDTQQIANCPNITQLQHKKDLSFDRGLVSVLSPLTTFLCFPEKTGVGLIEIITPKSQLTTLFHRSHRLTSDYFSKLSNKITRVYRHNHCPRDPLLVVPLDSVIHCNTFDAPLISTPQKVIEDILHATLLHDTKLIFFIGNKHT